ncbi:MMPL family transporter [Nocardioides yefusunii]|uniref:MMPL family transporter n=1 Tax=Nocardioides yefusunii TaxID=2500546 RepID=A0ABW1QUZ7_9ACTN|nr:MMPL family transporter [Nocardioides yefusunii]
MSSYLYRLGRAAARHARLVLVAWIVALIGLGAGAVALGGQLQQDLSIPGTEGQRGLDTLDQRFPLLAGATGQVLFVAPEGETVADHSDEVEKVLAAVEKVDQVATVTDPLALIDGAPGPNVSPDGGEALAQVILDVKLDDLDDATVPALEEATSLEGGDLEVNLGGSVFTTTSVEISATEGIGVLVALVVLAITFGSMLAAGLPIVTALVGVGATMAGLFAVAKFTTITSTTPTLALMIGLAVGIDYALFIVYRHRTQLAQKMGVEESVARAVATSGSAVIFAGVTVVIALCGLSVAGIPFLTVMGLAAAAGVAVAVAVAITLVPALLAMCGERLRPRDGSKAALRATGDGRRTLGSRWVAITTKVPALTVVVSVLVLLAMALPAKDLALGLPDGGTKDPGTSPRVTYDLVTDAFGAGMNSPLLVTTDIITSLEPVELVEEIAADLAKIDGVERVAMATPNPKGDLGVFQIIPEHGQTDPATADLVRALREAGPGFEKTYGVSDFTVTGQTAVSIDISDRLSGALLPFGLVVVGLSLVLLTIVFRSIAVPLKATAGYLLSVLASFGAVAMVFEYGWGAELFNVAKVGPVISFLPIILMGVLFGLAMDYEVFLVSRMREEYVHTGDADRAIQVGFTESARVVTAAAIIMIAVFAGFIPHGDSTTKPMAFGLAVGVFVDAFLVRMTLVPAVMALLGRKAWWLPASLERSLPHLDVEGEGLAHHVEHAAWVETHGPATVRATGIEFTDEQHAPLGAPFDLVVRPGELHVVSGSDAVLRAAVLAGVAGRLPHTSGTLVVLDRLMPEEGSAVRAASAHFAHWPDADALASLGRRTRLVVVDGIDRGVTDDEAARRWDALAGLAERGVTVVAGAERAPLHLPHTSLEPAADRTGALPGAHQEALA